MKTMEPTGTLTDTATDEDAAQDQRVAAQYLVVALDCARPLVSPARLWLDGKAALIGRGTRREWRRTREGLRLDLADGRISGSHARLVANGGKWLVEDLRSKNGTLLNGVRVEPAELRDRDLIEVGATLLMFRSHEHAGAPADEAAAPATAQPLPRTLHPGWSAALATLLRVGHSTAPVLLVGKTGTGKEVLAHTVHHASGRAGPFVPVNCGAIVRTLIESELFGVKKGAFSGAAEDRPGLLRSADGGTLFLDEVAELPEASQAALLRVLQEHE